MILLWITHCVLFSFLFLKLCDFDHYKLVSQWNYFFPSRKSAQSLFSELISFRINGKEFELSHYKFFTPIIEELIKSSLKFGTSIYSNLNEIKSALSKDIVFEKKINASIGGGLYQMILVAIIGYVFFGITQIQLKISLDYSNLIGIIIFQFVGIILFLFLSLKLKKYHFYPVEQYICFLYKLRAAVSSNQPISSCVDSDIFNNLCDSKSLKPFKQRFLDILRKIKSHGVLNSDDFKITINELWQTNEFKFEEFLKHLAALKLCILVFFFMGSFLYLLLLVTTVIGM